MTPELTPGIVTFDQVESLGIYCIFFFCYKKNSDYDGYFFQICYDSDYDHFFDVFDMFGKTEKIMIDLS